jgi:hypothetical protein
LRIKIPHVLNRFTFTATQATGEWAGTILYHDDESGSEIQKSFIVPYHKTFAAQAAALQQATQKTFEEIAKAIDVKEKEKNAEYKEVTKLPFKIHRTKNQQFIKSIDIAEGYELQLPAGLAATLKVKKNIYTTTNTKNDEFAWITCDFVGETMIGERALRLLTPTPLKISTATDVSNNKEYVPLTIAKFSILEIKMYTNLRTLELFDGPFNVLIVLHFKPMARHKRKASWEDDDSKKRHAGFGGRVLQQANPIGWWRSDDDE